ncbi:MAG: UDP-N-acetylmuramoyl-L-alanyl-D-glutamate--2,6-diaminopimelate ligase [Phycisphaerae bacterium]
MTPPSQTADARPATAVKLRALLTRALGLSTGLAGGREIEIRDVSADSRRIGPGGLFVAVHGTRKDGAAFIGDAVARGAEVVVVGPEDAVPPETVVVRVLDTATALARIAAALYGLDTIQASGGLRVIGITGTNGKSTVAYMTRAILEAAGHRVALLGTIAYDLAGKTLPAPLTTPDAVTLTRHLVESHTRGARLAVMEVSSHSLSQRRTDGITFDTAVFTNLTLDHLDYHGSIDAYCRTKRRLFDGLSDTAAAVINGDDPRAAEMVGQCDARVVRFGFDAAADVRAVEPVADTTGGRFRLEITKDARAGAFASCVIDGPSCAIRIPLIGRHNIANALAAAGAALSLGVDLSTIARGLAAVEHVPGRLQRVATGDPGFDVFVDYAHTDDALRNVLGALRPMTRGRLSCVFGCGGDRDRTKRPLMAQVVADHADAFVITSDNPRTEDPLAIIADIERGLSAAQRARCTVEPDRARAIARAIAQLDRGDILVIAGKGHETYQIVGSQRIPFDDVQVARKAISRRRRSTEGRKPDGPIGVARRSKTP